MTLFRVRNDELDHTFVVDVKMEEGWVTIKVDGKKVFLNEKNNRLELYSDAIRLNKRTRVTHVNIPDEIVTHLNELYAKAKAIRNEEDKKREADRPAPRLESGKFTFSLGCDTGLVYPEEYREAVNKILESGVKPEPVFRGSRDKTRKYPGSWDAFIPASYVQTREKDDGYGKYNTYSALGYESVWCEEQYSLPDELVQKTKQSIDEERARIKAEVEDKKKQRFNEILAIAKSTGEKQELHHWSDECDDPSEECDIDNVYEYLMPDGTVKVERNHTW